MRRMEIRWEIAITNANLWRETIYKKMLEI
jgi:hypothetical protein